MSDPATAAKAEDPQRGTGRTTRMLLKAFCRAYQLRLHGETIDEVHVVMVSHNAALTMREMCVRLFRAIYEDVAIDSLRNISHRPTGKVLMCFWGMNEIGCPRDHHGVYVDHEVERLRKLIAAPQVDIAPASKSQSDAESEIAATSLAELHTYLLRESLALLVDLKNHRDKHGRSPLYESLKIRAWTQARIALLATSGTPPVAGR